MALLTLGPVVTDIRNSVGGVTFSRNKGGAYARARVVPLNPSTPAQTLVRANFAANSKAWSGTLTADERAAWTALAAANPLVNVLGASIVVSGLAMFQKLNQVLAQIGAAMETDAPADLSVPALPTPTSIHLGSGSQIVEINTPAQSAPAGASYYVFATGPLAAGATPQSSQYRFMGAYPPVAAAVTVDISAAWVAKYGAFLGGQVVGIVVSTVNTATGAVTPGIVFSTLAG